MTLLLRLLGTGAEAFLLVIGQPFRNDGAQGFAEDFREGDSLDRRDDAGHAHDLGVNLDDLIVSLRLPGHRTHQGHLSPSIQRDHGTAFNLYSTKLPAYLITSRLDYKFTDC
jgi:hypothetical protein